MKLKYLLALLTGLLVTSQTMKADDGAAVTVTADNPNPNPVCSGSAVTVDFSAAVTAPANTQKELMITGTNYDWAAYDDTGLVDTKLNGAATWTPSWTPTGSGSKTLTAYVTNTFTGTQNSQTPNPTSYSTTATGSASATVQVDAVTSLTPSAGTWVDDGDNDPNTATYLVQYGCNNSITVSAVDCLGLNAAALPSCWQATNSVGSATKIDNKTFSVDGNTVGKTVINVTCGTSKTVTIIVYQAKVELDAQKGSFPSLFDFGHSWWNLTITPIDAYPFLQGTDPDTGDPVSLSGVDPYGPQTMGGFYDDQSLNGPGRVKFANPQPDQSTGGSHTATGSYWWCVSFNKYVATLQHIYDLALNPPEYRVASDNCTTEAEAVASTAGVQNVPPSIYPGELSKWLNGDAVVFTGISTIYQLPQPATCSCSQ